MQPALSSFARDSETASHMVSSGSNKLPLFTSALTSKRGRAWEHPGPECSWEVSYGDGAACCRSSVCQAARGYASHTQNSDTDYKESLNAALLGGHCRCARRKCRRLRLGHEIQTKWHYLVSLLAIMCCDPLASLRKLLSEGSHKYDSRGALKQLPLDIRTPVPILI